VEEAVEQGLEDLGLGEDEVEVEVLDAGSRGLFGIGARQARVRLTMKSVKPAEPVAHAEEAPSQAYIEIPPAILAEAERPETPAAPTRPAVSAGVQAVEDEAALRTAQETVSELLDKMKIRARVTARYGEAEDEHSRAPLLVDVRGNDLSILIGPRAETLNALQYIAGLIVSKELGRSIPLIVDVEGYRARREQLIRQLARRMADQAIKTGRRQVLEPMPASERRLVHIELRSNPQVTTESVGEEPRRKVTIIPHT
jgi:spoIIIJ-associated protein